MADVGSSLYIVYHHRLVKIEGTSLNLELKITRRTRVFCLVVVSFENNASKREGKTLHNGTQRGVCLFIF